MYNMQDFVHNNIFFITIQCKKPFYYDFSKACVNILRGMTFEGKRGFSAVKTIKDVCDRFCHIVAQINCYNETQFAVKSSIEDCC